MGDSKQLDKIQIVQWNACSLPSEGKSKLPEFLETFETKPEIVCLQERWSNKKQKQLMLKGYSPPANFRREINHQGGGVAKFVKGGIDHKLLTLPNQTLKQLGCKFSD